MTKEESKLKILKENYKKIQAQHNLPSFEKLNEDFQIERIAEIETDFLIREVRKYVADRLSNYLRSIEGILNPSNAPMFVFSIIKAIDSNDKKKFAEIYKKLSEIELELIELDIEFSEKKEAEFIKNSYKGWQEIKKELLEIVASIKKNWDNKSEANGRGYFG